MDSATKYQVIVFRCNGCGYVTMEQARMMQHLAYQKCENSWADRQIVWCHVVRRRPLTTFVPTTKDPAADAIVYRCSKCKIPSMEWNRTKGHIQIKRCRGSDILREHVTWGNVVHSSSLPAIDPNAEIPAETDAEIPADANPMNPAEEVQETHGLKKPTNFDLTKKRYFKNTVPFDDLTRRIPIVDAAGGTSDTAAGGTVDAALAIFRQLWGSEAPPEFRSVILKNRKILVSGTDGVKEYATLQEKTQCMLQFLRLIRAVSSPTFEDFFETAPTFEDILTRNEVYARTRHRSVDRVAAAKRFKQGFLDDLQNNSEADVTGTSPHGSLV